MIKKYNNNNNVNEFVDINVTITSIWLASIHSYFDELNVNILVLKLLIIMSLDQLDENSYNITNSLVLGEQWWSWNGICPSPSLLMYCTLLAMCFLLRLDLKRLMKYLQSLCFISHICTWELFVEHLCLLVLSKHNAIKGFRLQGHMPFVPSQCTKS